MPLLIAQNESLSLVEILILAIVQGIAEFLPISSSGHIVFTSELLDKSFDITEMNIVLHAGTLLSIVVYYRNEIVQLFRQDWNLLPKILVATLPAVMVGLGIKKFFPELLNDVLLVGFMFVTTGFLLLALGRMEQIESQRSEKEKINDESRQASKVSYREVTWRQAILIGCFQAAAILPGISRSGATIVAGCLFGLKRKSAATFSFLLAMPVIAGATLLESLDIIKAGPSTSYGMLALGFVISFVVGLLSLALLVRWLGQGRLHYFAYYVIPLGFLVIIRQIAVETGILETLFE